MVELKLFHKILLLIAVIILLIKLTERFAPKPVMKTLTSYIPKRRSEVRIPATVMPVAAPRYESTYIPPVTTPVRSMRPAPESRRERYVERSAPVSVSAPSPESSGEVFYIPGI